MAVVSISRIQVRRGRKNEGTGLPQLASGEFAWAVDSQELYIGNGSVAEGAPFVGNTQVLTENSNILEFASSYEYKESNQNIITGPDSNNPVKRSIQERLDEYVTVKSFGASGTGLDQTVEIQRAINQLFNNQGSVANNEVRMILHFDAGTYLVSDTIQLPANCIIKGAGKNRTIIQKNTVGPVFETVSNIAGDLPTNIVVENMSLILDGAAGFNLADCSDSIFRDIEIKGIWSLGDSDDVDSYGFAFDSTNSLVKNNEFTNIDIANFSYGFYSDFDAQNNIIKETTFDTCYNAVSFGEAITIGAAGQLIGPSNNLIESNVFNNIANHAILIAEGNNNLSKSNKFYNTGFAVVSGVFDKRDPTASIIKFGITTEGNTSSDDWFERTGEYTSGQNYIQFVPYVPEVQGPAVFKNSFKNKIDVGQLSQPAVLLKLPADSAQTIELDYLFKSVIYSIVRKGTIRITVDPINSQKNLSDEFDYAGDTNYMENLEFTADLFDENNDGNIDSIGLSVLNLSFNDQAELSYTINTFR